MTEVQDVQERAGRSGVATEPAPFDILLSTQDAAALLGVTADWIRRLSAAGWFTKTDRNCFRLVDVVQGHIKFLKDETKRLTKTESARRVMEARAVEIELRTALRAGKLMEVDEHFEIMEELIGMFLTGLGGLAARCSIDLPMRRKIEIGCRELQQSLSNKAAGNAAKVKAKQA